MIKNIELDISDFGYRERKLVIELLLALDSKHNNLTERLDQTSLRIGFNTESGYVYLFDDNYNVAMMRNNALVDVVTCPECGCEDFLDEFEEKQCPNDTIEYVCNKCGGIV